MRRYLVPFLLNGVIALTGCGVAGVALSAASNKASAGTGTSASGEAGATGSTGTTGTGSTSTGGLNGATGAPAGTSSPGGSAAAGSADVATTAQAARFLDQATFGPTTKDVALVRVEGPGAWLQQQFAAQPTLLAPVPDPLPAQYVAEDASLSQDSAWGSEWWGAALTAPDQLRQRVAFALSHIYVISNDSIGGRATTFYYNILLQDAFSNWRQLMQDVTLSPGMGDFLNMANSGAAPAGQIANENFARENMQLARVAPY